MPIYEFQQLIECSKGESIMAEIDLLEQIPFFGCAGLGFCFDSVNYASSAIEYLGIRFAFRRVFRAIVFFRFIFTMNSDSVMYDAGIRMFSINMS